jgi:GTP pyrophosphokinase
MPASSASCSARRKGARIDASGRAVQVERVRKMLLAFSRDLRVVLLRLASRLQTLRFFAASKTPCPPDLAAEAMQVFAPLANRLGIWQIKWELEDLAFRFLDPEQYRTSPSARRDARRSRGARRGDALEPGRRPGRARPRGRGARPAEASLQHLEEDAQEAPRLREGARRHRPARHRQGRRRVLCRARPRPRALSRDRRRARRLHRAAEGERLPVASHRRRGDDGGAVEIQIRTAEMHEHAEYGVSAHWAYKEADAANAAVSAGGSFEAKVAQARLVVCASCSPGSAISPATARPRRPGPATTRRCRTARVAFDDRIYVFTPQAAVVELTAGATPIDFAYAVHTDLGHRCRGAKVDGAIVPLNTPLQSGQMVEVTAAKVGGPSLDWLNPELGYLQSARSKAKVRSWFNAQAQAATIARGREAVEKLLQREGRPRSSTPSSRRGSAFAAPTRCSRSSARTSFR